MPGPGTAAALKIKVSVDLVQNALHQVSFLKSVSREPALLEPVILQEAIARYETLWLPLLAGQNKQEPLPAPLDIEWVWHCHMLAPNAYQHDCMQIVGKIIDHKLYSEKDRSKKLATSRQIWEAAYPKEPFDLDLKNFRGREEASGRSTKITYDIVASALRQKEFYYQVSLPHYTDTKFLKFALNRYRKFLYLKQQEPSLFIVPCYDTDLMWHTHILHPLFYKHDTELLHGKTFNHDDSVNDRSEGSKLNTSQQATQRSWLTAFNENFMLFGAMWRGNNPIGKLFSMTSQNCYELATKSCNVRFERLELKNLPAMNGKLKLKIYTSANNKVKKTCATLVGEPLWQGKSVAEVNFDTREVNCLKFSVMEQTGFACFGSKVVLAENELNLLPFINAIAQPSPLEKTMPLGQVRMNLAHWLICIIHFQFC